jgi:hypothetical protein
MIILHTKNKIKRSDQKMEYIKPVGWQGEQKRVRHQMIDNDETCTSIAAALGIKYQDVSAVVRQVSRSPKHREAVYAHLGLMMPVIQADERSGA